jgi:phosphatidylglycerophosphatase C
VGLAQGPGLNVGGPRPGVAAFDFDGTLVPGDSLLPFLLRLLGPSRFVQAAARSAPAMVAAYRRLGRDGSKAVLLARTVTGLPVATVTATGAGYGWALGDRVRPAMAARVRWHQEQGHRVVLVSASLTAYLDAFAQRLGFDDVIATRLEEGPDGRLTGRLLGANVRGPEKAARLRRLLDDAEVELWAYGDSPGDRDLLAMADHGVLVGRRAGPGDLATPPS